MSEETESYAIYAIFNPYTGEMDPAASFGGDREAFKEQLGELMAWGYFWGIGMEREERDAWLASSERREWFEERTPEQKNKLKTMVTPEEVAR